LKVEAVLRGNVFQVRAGSRRGQEYCGRFLLLVEYRFDTSGDIWRLAVRRYRENVIKVAYATPPLPSAIINIEERISNCARQGELMGTTSMAVMLKDLLRKSHLSPGLLAVAAIFAVALAVMLAGMNRGVNLYDEGVIATGAVRVMAGDVMHRDFYANYGPAQFYILAALFKLFGPSILVARLWGALVKASIAVAVYMLGKRIMPTAWSLVSCAFSIVWLTLADNTTWPAWPALLATIGSILVFDAMFDKGRSLNKVFAAGLLVGIATLFRYDIGFIICAAEAAVLVPYSFTTAATGRPGGKAVVVNLGAFCAGILLVCTPVAAAFWYAGAVGDLLFDVVRFPSQHYAATRSLPFPLPQPGRRPFNVSEYIVYFPLLMCLGVAIVALLSRIQGSFKPRFGTGTVDSRRGMWDLALLCAVTIGLFSKGLVRVSALHMSLAVVPATLMLAALLSANARSTRVSLGFAAFLAIAMTAGVIPTLNAYHSVTGRIAYNLRDISEADRHDSTAPGRIDMADPCHPSPGLERVTCFQLAADQAAAVNYVRANTTVSDPIYVGLPQHERIFANNVAFYFVANRRPATKWYHFDPGLQTSKAIQELMIGDLLQSRPKFVVLDAEWEGWREPNESAKSSGVQLLDEFIADNYQRVATFGSLTILKPLIAGVPPS
jgi:hypothetical protein